jgi:fructosamine-3-kinase
MLASEAEGLEALRKAGALSVPLLQGFEKTASGAVLLLEYIPPGRGAGAAHEALGRGLALMHQSTHEAFGWRRDNYIGALPQKNDWEVNWAVFFANHRLRTQFDLAVSSNFFEGDKVPDPGHMALKIAALLPDLKPALLHGDLWNGNYLVSENNLPYLIDPSVHFGHSEVDLAMSRLFGGFPSRFYDAYFEISPRQPGFEDRQILYQLYYLLVHLNLFGRSYLPAVSEATKVIFGGD